MNNEKETVCFAQLLVERCAREAEEIAGEWCEAFFWTHLATLVEEQRNSATLRHNFYVQASRLTNKAAKDYLVASVESFDQRGTTWTQLVVQSYYADARYLTDIANCWYATETDIRQAIDAQVKAANESKKERKKRGVKAVKRVWLGFDPAAKTLAIAENEIHVVDSSHSNNDVITFCGKQMKALIICSHASYNKALEALRDNAFRYDICRTCRTLVRTEDKNASTA